MRRPRHPILLGLQALALCALVLALAGPARRGAAPAPTTVYVVDGSLWMHVGTRLADARADVRRLAAAEPDAHVALVAATGTPSVAYQGPASGLAGALGVLRAGSGSADLASGDRARRRLARRSPRPTGRRPRTRGRDPGDRVRSSSGRRPRGGQARARPGPVRPGLALRHRAGGGVRGRGDAAQRGSRPPRRSLRRVPGRHARARPESGSACARYDDRHADRPARLVRAPAATRARRARPRRRRVVHRAERGRYAAVHDGHARRRSGHRQAARAGARCRTRGEPRAAHASDLPPQRRAPERPRRARRLGPADRASARAGGRADRASPAPGWRRGGTARCSAREQHGRGP